MQLSIIILFLLLLTNCASYQQETEEIRTLYRSHHYDQALKEIDESELKEQQRNRLLYLLEKAMILDRLEDRKKSRALLIDADKLSDELYTTRISKEVASYLYNDSATDYAGEDYEKVAIHTVLALSFLDDQDLNGARVEAAKINNKLYEINQKYEERKNRYTEDAFARYLAGMIWEAKAEYDSAIIDYRNALKIYEGVYGDLFDTAVPDQLVQNLYKLAIKRQRNEIKSELEKRYPKLAKDGERLVKESNGELVILHEVGHIANKEAEDFVLPISGQVVRFSFPIIRPNRQYFGTTGVEVEQKFFASELVQNHDLIAKETLEDKRFRMVLKEGARLLAKGQITEQAYRNLGPIAGIAANIYAVVTETADTRSWTLLPSRIKVTRVPLKPGEYQVQIKTNGQITKMDSVKIEANKIMFVRDSG